MRQVMRDLAAGDHAGVPGMIRMSPGVYNTAEEVDYFLDAVRQLLADGPQGRYVLDACHMDYVPDPPAFSLDQYAPL
jgi:hypothetical protein